MADPETNAVRAAAEPLLRNLGAYAPLPDGACLGVPVGMLRKLHADLSTPGPVIPMGTGDAIREALGAHIQADAYRDSFPDDDDDLASNRQSEAWWRLKAREWTPDSIDHECAEAAKARILRENGNG